MRSSDIYVHVILMIKDLKHLGASIRARRSELDVSQGELAFQLGTDKAYISRIERGEINIGVIFLTELCVVMKTTPNHLLNIDGETCITHSISRGRKKG